MDYIKRINKNKKIDKNSYIIKKISVSITLIIMATILCSGIIMHIIVN